MVSNKTLFEQNMIKLGNHPTSIYKNITYEYKKRGDSANVVYVELDKYFKLNPLMTDVTKSSVFASSFAENYNLDDSTASTFYKFYQIKIQLIRGKLLSSGNGVNSLRMQYASSSDYLNLLKQVTDIAKYIETKPTDEAEDEYISIYKYDKYIIEVVKLSDIRYGKGGIITIKL